jgi:hypothetical protein
MSEVKDRSIANTPTGSIQMTGPEPIKKYSQTQMSAALAEVNRHYIERIQTEWQEAAGLVANLNAAMLATDKVRLYQDWLKDFSYRRIEDANYAMEAVRKLSYVEMKLSMGLLDKQDQQAATAV